MAETSDDTLDVLVETGSHSSSTDEDESLLGTSWVDVAWLMLSDIVGTSVLTFAGVTKQLGSVLTVVFIVGLFPVSLYVSILMTRTRALVTKAATSQNKAMPRLATMGDVAGAVLQSERASKVVYFVVYGYTILGLASYLLVLGETLQNAYYTHEVCIYTAVGLGCACLAIPVIAVRHLGESVTLCFINLLLIVAVVIIALVSIGVTHDPACVNTYAFAPGLSFSTAFGAATNVVYSYAGQWMYFEIMDTMNVPKDFPKAFAVTGPIMVSIYLAVALVGFSFGVHADDMIHGMPYGKPLRIASTLLFAHVMIVYLVKSIVVQQYFHRLTSPKDIDRRTPASYLNHGGWGVAMLMAGFLFANAVPFFNQMLGLIGGFLGGPINFMFPIFLFLVARGRDSNASSYKDVAGDSSGEDKSLEVDGRDVSKNSCLRAVCAALRKVGFLELFLILFTYVFIIMTMVLGVTDVIMQIIDLNGKFGAPFSCHALSPRASNSSTCP